jgi:UDP-N-acetylmuramate--alanine ligase
LIYTDFKITLKGSHNVLNSLACFGVAVSLNINPTEIKDALSSFQGIKRRFTEIGTFQGAKVIDDYAHHPTEIKVVIDAATKIIHSTNKVIAVIQPHRYTRLKDNFQEFINVLSTTDYVILLDVYSAGENIIEGYNSNSLKDNLIKIKDKDTVFYLSDSNLLPNILTTIAKKNDIIIFMGAGDITNIAKNFVQL